MLSLFIGIKDWLLHGPVPNVNVQGNLAPVPQQVTAMDKLAQRTMEKTNRQRKLQSAKPAKDSLSYKYPDTLRRDCSKMYFYWGVALVGDRGPWNPGGMVYIPPPRAGEYIEFENQLWEVAGYQELGWIIWVYPARIRTVCWE